MLQRNQFRIKYASAVFTQIL